MARPPLLRALSLLLATSAFAQTPAEPVVHLDPFAVIAHPSGADERAASVWVLSPDLAAPAPLRTADLLLGVPGAHLDQPGGPGGRATLYLRGAEENYSVVFLDGIPLNDPTNNRGGAVDLSLVEPSLLGQVAVVRGAPSVRYGPDALAGAVHLNSDTTPGSRLFFEAGGNALVRGGFNGTQALGAASDHLTLGLGAAAAEEGSLADGSRAQRRFVRAAVDGGSSLKFHVSVWHARNTADSFPDESGGRAFAIIRDLEHRADRQTAGRLALDGAAGAGRWTAGADTAQFNSLVTSPGVAPGARDPMGLPASRDDTRLRRTRAHAAYEQTVSGWRLAAGLDAQREEGRSAATLAYGPLVFPADFAVDRTRFGAFAEASAGLLPHLTLVAGARGDHDDDGATRGTFRGGLLGQIDDATQWRLNAGNAFKPASFYALANPLVGNPSLRPERARMIDTGLRRAFAGGRALVDLTAFASAYRNGIEFDAGPPPQLRNFSRIQSVGAEAAATLRPLAALSFTAAAGYTDSQRETTTGDWERTRSRPRWNGRLAATWQAHAKLALTGSWTLTGDVPDTSIPTGEVLLGSWTRLDLAAVWQCTPALAFTAALDNALDRTYAEAVGFSAPGRRLRAGLQARF